MTATSPSPRRPRLGFLGVGWIGTRRLEAIVEAQVAEVVALADPSAEMVERAAENAPNARRCASLEELLAMDLDGILIATPSAQHARESISALERGLAVFCQKPLGRDTAEVTATIAAARTADRLLGVDLSYRHTDAMQQIRPLVRSGALGEIFAVDLVFHNAFGPQPRWFSTPGSPAAGA